MRILNANNTVSYERPLWRAPLRASFGLNPQTVLAFRRAHGHDHEGRFFCGDKPFDGHVRKSVL